MKILVTDELGFIGSDLGQSEGPNYIRCDVSEYRQLESIFDEHKFDYVYHLAAEYGCWNGKDYYENLWLTNEVGTKNIIRLQEKQEGKWNGY